MRYMKKISIDNISIVTVGWSPDLIGRIIDRLALPESIMFEHLLHPSIDQSKLNKEWSKRKNIHLFQESISKTVLPEADILGLKSLELEGVPTIREMIMSDRIVKYLPLEDTLAYMTMIYHRITSVITRVNPLFVVGSFDSVHSGVACGVAKKLGIPFLTLKFSVIPESLCCMNIGLVPNSILKLNYYDEERLRKLAYKTLDGFEKRIVIAPAYQSPDGVKDLISRLPVHLKVLFRSVYETLTGSHFRFTASPVHSLIKVYIRRRYNRLMLSCTSFITTVPTTPFVFYGFHMQPESSIDVWGSFFSDQFNVIENIVRATPIDHLVLVKIHRSDVDNYSPYQLKRIINLPRVRLIMPFVSSYEFIAKAAISFTIQGTIGLEAALLGRPVIVFGDNMLKLFPSVKQVGRLSDLPRLIRDQLVNAPIDRELIVNSYCEYLRHYFNSSSNNWNKDITIDNLDGYSSLFRAAIEYCVTTKIS